MRGFVEALRVATCLDFVSPEVGSRPRQSHVVRWFPMLGTLFAGVAAWFYAPVAELLLPSDVALPLALVLWVFILNFRPEEGLWKAAASGGKPWMPVVMLAFAVLLRFAIYRQFFGSELPRVFILGGTASYCAPLFLAARAAVSPLPDAVERPSRGWMVLVWIYWISVVVLCLVPGVSGWPSIMRGTICIVGATMIMHMLASVWLRESFGRLPARYLFCASIPSELAACAGFLIVRSQFL